MKRYHAIHVGAGPMSSKGGYDDDPHVGTVKVEEDGKIFQTGGSSNFLFWHIGRMEPSGQLVAYIPGLADVKREELTEKQFNNPSSRMAAVRRAANKGETA